MRIDYEFTRLDHEHRCVNILYIEATGSGETPYERDISASSHLRGVPAMREYFGHMNAYHLSYAAFTNDDSHDLGYIRARRYMAGPLEGTEMEPDYDPAGFFDYGVPHRMTAIKSGDHVYPRGSLPRLEDIHAMMPISSQPSVAGVRERAIAHLHDTVATMIPNQVVDRPRSRVNAVSR